MKTKKEKRNFFKEWDTAIKSIGFFKNSKQPIVMRSLPKRKPFKKWTANEYDMAANAVTEAMKLTSHEWGIIRYAIRKAVEENS